MLVKKIACLVFLSFSFERAPGFALVSWSVEWHYDYALFWWHQLGSFFEGYLFWWLRSAGLLSFDSKHLFPLIYLMCPKPCNSCLCVPNLGQLPLWVLSVSHSHLAERCAENSYIYLINTGWYAATWLAASYETWPKSLILWACGLDLEKSKDHTVVRWCGKLTRVEVQVLWEQLG